MTAELCPMEPGAPVGCRGVGSGEAPRFHCRCPLGSREDGGCDGRIQCRGSLRRWSPTLARTFALPRLGSCNGLCVEHCQARCGWG